jgi:uncharacterized membrane protein
MDMSGIINWITDAVLWMCFGVRELAVAVVSMVPIIELKGGIPIGLRLGLSQWGSFLWAFLGSSLICVPRLLLLPLLFKIPFLKRVENIFREKASKISPKWKFWGVFLFAAVPLPGTGVWTSSIVAVILGFRFWQSILIIITGNLISGLAIVGLTALLGSAAVDTILFILLIVFVLLVIVFFYKIFRQKDTANVTGKEKP